MCIKKLGCYQARDKKSQERNRLFNTSFRAKVLNIKIRFKDLNEGNDKRQDKFEKCLGCQLAKLEKF